MSSRNDPLKKARRRLLAIGLLGLTAWGLALVWALDRAPIEVAGQARDTGEKPLAAEPPEPSQAQPIDPEAFALELWNPPPPPDETGEEVDTDPRSQPRVEAPLSLTLIGVTESEGEREAAIYEPKADRLHLVRRGDRVLQFEVQAVLPDTVRLHDGRRTRQITMKRADR